MVKIFQQFRVKKNILIFSTLNYLQKNIFPAIFASDFSQKTRNAGRTP
jgi:hypothetical protein